MSFFKPFKKNPLNYTLLSQNESEPGDLPRPVTDGRAGAAGSAGAGSGGADVGQGGQGGFRAKLSKLNPFRNNSVYLEDDDNYVTSDPGYFELSRWDRMLIFGLTFAGSISCWLICIFLFPVLTLKPKKFALLWSLGSLFFLVSFGVLQGFQAYLQHLFLSTRIIFTVVFVTSIILTLISSLSLKSTILSIIFAIVQLLSAVWYTVSYFPMGKQTLNLASSVARSQAESWIRS